MYPTPVTSRQSGPKLTTCRPWEMTPNTSTTSPTTTPSASRVGRVTCGWARAHVAAMATITATPIADVSGPEKARSSRWAVTRARPASRSGRSARAIRSRRRRRGAVGATGPGCASARSGSSVIGVMASRSPTGGRRGTVQTRRGPGLHRCVGGTGSPRCSGVHRFASITATAPQVGYVWRGAECAQRAGDAVRQERRRSHRLPGGGRWPGRPHRRPRLHLASSRWRGNRRRSRRSIGGWRRSAG